MRCPLSDRRESRATAKWLLHFAFCVGCACKFRSHTNICSLVCSACRLDLHDFQHSNSSLISPKAKKFCFTWGFAAKKAPGELHRGHSREYISLQFCCNTLLLLPNPEPQKMRLHSRDVDSYISSNRHAPKRRLQQSGTTRLYFP